MNTPNDTVRSTIYEASLALDECRWQDWLALCDDQFYYAIKAFSPEIHYDMTYLDASLAEMVSMCELLPKHNTDHSPLSRHTVVYRVAVDEAERARPRSRRSPSTGPSSTAWPPTSKRARRTSSWSASTTTGSSSRTEVRSSWSASCGSIRAASTRDRTGRSDADATAAIEAETTIRANRIDWYRIPYPA